MGHAQDCAAVAPACTRSCGSGVRIQHSPPPSKLFAPCHGRLLHSSRSCDFLSWGGSLESPSRMLAELSYPHPFDWLQQRFARSPRFASSAAEKETPAVTAAAAAATLFFLHAHSFACRVGRVQQQNANAQHRRRTTNVGASGRESAFPCSPEQRSSKRRTLWSREGRGVFMPRYEAQRRRGKLFLIRCV